MFRRNRRVLIFAAIVATFVYGMIAAMLGTILPDLSSGSMISVVFATSGLAACCVAQFAEWKTHN